MSFFQEFKTFALKGNMVDMAVGIVVGAAFTKVVNSLVSDLLMPPLGFLIGGIDFSHLSMVLKKATLSQPAVTINYGLFLNQLVDFLIIALVIFMVIKGMNQLKRQKKVEMPTCRECLMEIPKGARRCGHCGESLA